jgi:hypothetical protein
MYVDRCKRTASQSDIPFEPPKGWTMSSIQAFQNKSSTQKKGSILTAAAEEAAEAVEAVDWIFPC